MAIRFLLVRVYHCSPCFYYYLLCLFSHSGAAADHSNGIEGGPGLCFVLFHLVAQKSETDQSVSMIYVCFFLTHIFSITHLPFQATINMSGGSEMEDCCAGLPPEDESNASRFCRDIESAAVAVPGTELGRGCVQLLKQCCG